MLGVLRKNALLNDLKDNKISVEELLLKCAEWVAEEVDDYKFTPIPLAPKEVMDYMRIPENSRMNIDSQYYNDHPQILAFFALKRAVHFGNKYLYDWLKECLGLVTTEEEKSKIIRKMSELPVEGGEQYA
jgi:hypothetical protein